MQPGHHPVHEYSCPELRAATLLVSLPPGSVPRASGRPRAPSDIHTGAERDPRALIAFPSPHLLKAASLPPRSAPASHITP